MSLGNKLRRTGFLQNYQWSRPGQFGRVGVKLDFNRQLPSRLDRKEKRVLTGTGAFGRAVMRRQLRPGGKKGKSSWPGEPPRYHTRGPNSLKDGIFFRVNMEDGNVRIGPRKLKTMVRASAASAELLEFGGRGTQTVKRFNTNRPPRIERRRGTWRGNPFVRPTLRPTAQKLRELMAKVNL